MALGWVRSKWTTTLIMISGAVAVQPYRPLVFVGNSMTPTYSNLAVGWTRPYDGAEKLHAGDIVVLRAPGGEIVKRVAFVAGDKIAQYRAGDEWLDMISLRGDDRKGDPRFRYFTVPEGQVYVLGDNRMGSIDSRVYGTFGLDKIDRVVINPKTYHEQVLPNNAPKHRVTHYAYRVNP